MSVIQLKKKIVFSGFVYLKTGLHIGGTNASLNIGGPDKFVVRNPINNVPYIPGSSLKGKMRALVEIANGCVKTDGEKAGPSDDSNSISGRLFGVSGDSSNSRPSRLIVRDAELDIAYQDYSKTDLPYTESKTEVAIDRVTAKAKPRTFERVPAGSRFKLEMILNIFDGEDEQQLRTTLKQAICLLHDDYLGGQGSRGYGQVEIVLDSEEGTEKTYQLWQGIL